MGIRTVGAGLDKLWIDLACLRMVGQPILWTRWRECAEAVIGFSGPLYGGRQAGGGPDSGATCLQIR